jgi:hypothetical protein
MMWTVLMPMGLAIMLLGGLSVPAAAEHGEVHSSVDLKVDLKVTPDGFRLGGQLLGLKQAYEAWVNGQVRPNGLSLDGRLQDGARAFNFKLNADIDRALLGTRGQEPF